MATYFLDVEGGNDAADGTSFANRVKTLTVASNLLAPGDTLKLMQAYAPNSLGVNGTFVRGSTKITLASAVTQLLFAGSASGTVSSNVTYTSTTTRKSSTAYAQIAIGSAFTTGKAWYYDFGATDLSGYQQISFWMQMTTGTLAANLSFRICSDATGDVSVNTFTIPACGATSQWHRVTINLGSAMSASATTLALYVDSDQGAQTVIIGNINACKAPGTGELHLKSFIGKAKSLGAGGDDSETWYAIRAIEGTTVALDLLNSSSAGSTANGRYWGASETATAYSIVPCWMPVTNAATDNYLFAAGTASSRITVSGGWNRTDMSTQTGHTWLAWQNQQGSQPTCSLYVSAADISKINFAMSNVVSMVGDANTVGEMHVINNSGTTIQSSNSTVSRLVCVNVTGSSFVGSQLCSVSSCLFCTDQNGSGLYISGPGSYAVVESASLLTYAAASGCPNGGAIAIASVDYGVRGPSQIADHVIRRDMANVFASTDGDTIDINSLYGCTQQAQKFNRSTGVVKNPNGTTLHTFTISTNGALDPIEQVA